MQFSVRSLMFAVPWFGIASLALAQIVHFRELARIARTHGSWVCGNNEMLSANALVIAIVAGAVALSGRHRAAVAIGCIAAALIVLNFSNP
jgi:hypothetical protein